MGIFLKRMADKMKEGKIVCGVCVSLNDPAVSELVGMAGYDFVWIEGEHGAMGRDAESDDRRSCRRRGCHGQGALSGCSAGPPCSGHGT